MTAHCYFEKLFFFAEMLKQWREDVNKKNSGVTYSWLYVKQEFYEKYAARDFTRLVKLFNQ